MNTEIEIKFLNINPAKLEEKLRIIGAKKIFDEVLEEWIFKKTEWKSVQGRVRIRRIGDKTELTYKETTQVTSKGNVEIEFSVDDALQAQEFIEKLGVPLVRHQQKRRIHYKLNGVSIDIDFWPKIPPFVEIEAKSKVVIETVVQHLGFSMQDACELDANGVIQDIYHIPLKTMKEYCFEEKVLGG